MGGEDGRAGGHGFGNGEAEAFVPAEGCYKGHALKEGGEFRAGAFTVEDDALAEARRGNFFFEGPLVIAELGRGFADDDDGGSGIFFQKRKGGVDEEVDSFLRTHAAEDADAVVAREA